MMVQGMVSSCRHSCWSWWDWDWISLSQLLLPGLDLINQLLQVLVNEPPEVVQINHGQSLQRLTSQALKHDPRHLLLPILLPQLLQLLVGFHNPLPQKGLLVDHLFALRRASMFGVHQACNHAFHRHCIIKCVNSETSQSHCPIAGSRNSKDERKTRITFRKLGSQ
ncbi:hypothetical protein Prudu_018071 [Prunus dulcis]|uniref:Anaphase-promoting complex subunit 11 RING-H2 finger domain-containing protein n=1 Tax=Prunus dulcis TaxID=3755 RepID=A0A4Y1RPY6_PRUDU|nr:hypothetical protein Prudu_018071 [Prunus dulcis]